MGVFEDKGTLGIMDNLPPSPSPHSLFHCLLGTRGSQTLNVQVVYYVMDLESETQTILQHQS